MSALGLLLICGAVFAAEPVVGAPTPAGDVDPVTQRRAQEALDAMAEAGAPAAPAGPVDPLLAERMAGIEGWLREIALLLDKNEPSAAGERFLLASEALKAMEADQRAALGKRYLLARDRLQGFARAFAEGAE